MAKVKLPLEMQNGVKVRTIEELKENFDIKKIIGYFIDGKLKTWLEVRYYEEELEKVNELSQTDSKLGEKLCKIFNVEYVDEKIDIKNIQKEKERLLKLKQFTDDEEVIGNINNVAFSQEELVDLYDKGVKKIYLCDGEFKIPKSKMDINYVELNNAVVEYEVTKNNFVLTSELADLIEDEYMELEDYVVWKVNIMDTESNRYKKYFSDKKKLDDMCAVLGCNLYYVWNFKKDEYSSFAIPFSSSCRCISNGNELIFSEFKPLDKYPHSIKSFDILNNSLKVLFESKDDIDIYSLTNVCNNKINFECNDCSVLLDINNLEVKILRNPGACLFNNMIITINKGYKVLFENILSREIEEKELEKYYHWYSSWCCNDEFFMLTDCYIVGINGDKLIKKYCEIKIEAPVTCVYGGYSSKFCVFYEERYSFINKLYVFDKHNKELKIYNIDDRNFYISDMKPYMINKYLYFKDKYKKYRIDLSKELEIVEIKKGE